MVTQFLLDFVWGDADSGFLLTIKDSSGNPVDLTGATNLHLSCMSMDGSDAFVVTGTVNGAPTNGQILFSGLASAPAQPPRGKRVSYRAIPNWTPQGAGSPTWGKTEFRFSVEVFP